jgi:hypothetical protein
MSRSSEVWRTSAKKMSLWAFVGLARAEATARPLASWSWEVVRAFLVMGLWVGGFLLGGLLFNLVLFGFALPELLHMVDGVPAIGLQAGLLGVLIDLVMFVLFLLSHPLAVGTVLVFLAVFPLFWAYIGWKQGRSRVLTRWVNVVRNPVRQWADLVRKMAPAEALHVVCTAAEALANVLDALLQWRERRWRLVRAATAAATAVVEELRSLLRSLASLENPDAVEQALASLEARAHFGIWQAIGVLGSVNFIWFLVIKLFV